MFFSIILFPSWGQKSQWRLDLKNKANSSITACPSLFLYNPLVLLRIFILGKYYIKAALRIILHVCHILKQNLLSSVSEASRTAARTILRNTPLPKLQGRSVTAFMITAWYLKSIRHLSCVLVGHRLPSDSLKYIKIMAKIFYFIRTKFKLISFHSQGLSQHFIYCSEFLHGV